MKYNYTAKTKEGKEEVGTIDAPDKFIAARELRLRGLTPLHVEEPHHKKGEINIAFIDNILNRIKLRDKIFFTRNISGMVRAGLSLPRALSVLEKQTKNKKFKAVLTDLIKEIDSGSTLSAGMDKHKEVFSTLFVSMVKAGEESGNLAGALEEIGMNLEKTYNLSKKIKGAMTYPAVILCAIVLIAILMFIYVIPTLVQTFKDFGSELPASTKFIIFLSDTISNHTILFLCALGAIISGIIYFIRSKRTQKYFDYILIRLPVIGTMVKEFNSARTTRTLASLLTSGVDMIRSIEITTDVMQNVYYKKVMEQAKGIVEKGSPLSTLFKANEKLYPVMVGEMMEVGEETGKLSDMLIQIALFYESEVDQKTKDLSTIIEPLLMIFIGAGVGFFAISMISPMYSLVGSI